MTPGDKAILTYFQRTREKTIDLLKKVPPRLLNSKTKGEEETMGDLFHHIAAAVNGWMFRCMEDGGTPPDWKPGKKRTKAALLKGLRASQARLLKHFKARSGASMSAIYRPIREGKKYRFTGRDRVLYLACHESHHRGKIVLALRQSGLKDIPFIPFRYFAKPD